MTLTTHPAPSTGFYGPLSGWQAPVTAIQEGHSPMMGIQPFHTALGEIDSTAPKLDRTEEAFWVRWETSSSCILQSS